MAEGDITLPTGWINCPSVGEEVEDLFYPFKTPLDERYNSLVPLNKRFGMKKVSQLIMAKNIKLIIDLTSTNNFYEKNSLKKIQYLRVFDNGFEGIPNDEHVGRFIRVVKVITVKDKEARVGVHCNHGFNMTGFMIATYLIKAKGLSLKDALEAFRDARPPGIFDVKYIDALKLMFDKRADVVIPEAPSWAGSNQCVKPKTKAKPKPKAKPLDAVSETCQSKSQTFQAKNTAISAEFVETDSTTSSLSLEGPKQCIKPKAKAMAENVERIAETCQTKPETIQLAKPPISAEFVESDSTSSSLSLEAPRPRQESICQPTPTNFVESDSLSSLSSLSSHGGKNKKIERTKKVKSKEVKQSPLKGQNDKKSTKAKEKLIGPDRKSKGKDVKKINVSQFSNISKPSLDEEVCPLPESVKAPKIQLPSKAKSPKGMTQTLQPKTQPMHVDTFGDDLSSLSSLSSLEGKKTKVRKTSEKGHISPLKDQNKNDVKQLAKAVNKKLKKAIPKPVRTGGKKTMAEQTEDNRKQIRQRNEKGYLLSPESSHSTDEGSREPPKSPTLPFDLKKISNLTSINIVVNEAIKATKASEEKYSVAAACPFKSQKIIKPTTSKVISEKPCATFSISDTTEEKSITEEYVVPEIKKKPSYVYNRDISDEMDERSIFMPKEKIQIPSYQIQNPLVKTSCPRLPKVTEVMTELIEGVQLSINDFMKKRKELQLAREKEETALKRDLSSYKIPRKSPTKPIENSQVESSKEITIESNVVEDRCEVTPDTGSHVEHRHKDTKEDYHRSSSRRDRPDNWKRHRRSRSSDDKGNKDHFPKRSRYEDKRSYGKGAPSRDYAKDRRRDDDLRSKKYSKKEYKFDRRPGKRDLSPDPRYSRPDKKHRYDKESPMKISSTVSFLIKTDDVYPVTDIEKLDNLKHKLRRLLNLTSISTFIGTKYTTLTQKNFKRIRESEFYNSWTTDGKRYLLYIIDEYEMYTIDEMNNFFRVKKLRIPNYDGKRKSLTETVFDGEVVMDRIDGKYVSIYLIAGVYAIEGKIYEEQDLLKRLIAIEAISIRPRKALNLCDKEGEPFNLGMKKFLKNEFINHVWKKLRTVVPHKMTGLVFYPKNSSKYKDWGAMTIFHWTPPEEKIINFKLVSEKDPNTREYYGELYARGSDKPFARISDLKQHEYKKFNLKIIQCVYNASTDSWSMLDIEENRDLQVTKCDLPELFEDIRNPVTFTDLETLV